MRRAFALPLRQSAAAAGLLAGVRRATTTTTTTTSTASPAAAATAAAATPAASSTGPAMAEDKVASKLSSSKPPGMPAEGAAAPTGAVTKERPKRKPATVIKGKSPSREMQATVEYYYREDPAKMREAHKKLAHLAPSHKDRLLGWGTVAYEVAPVLSTAAFGLGGLVSFAMSGCAVPDWTTVAQVGASYTAVQRFLARGSGGCPTTGMRDMKGKVCLVTGASSGIGLQVAAKLLDRGAVVIATHYNKSADETKELILKTVMPDTRDKLESDNINQLVVWPLRLEDRSTITRLANSVRKQFPKGLDVLINNAGNMMGEDLVETNGIETTIDVSFVGTYALTETLLPLVHKVDGRVIFMTSHAHRIVTTRDDPNKMVARTIGYKHTGDDDMRYHRSRQFSQAKFGNTCHAVALDNRGIKACAVNPGRTNTLLRRHVFPLLGTRYYWPGVAWMLRSPNEGAQSVLYAATVPDDKFVSGGYYFNCKARPHGMSPFVKMAADAACDWAARESKVPVTRFAPKRQPSKPSENKIPVASHKPKPTEE